MKLFNTFFRSVFITIAFFACAMNINAQNNSNGNGKLWERENGTNNIFNSPLEGNVGIGTSSPQYPLDVKGKLVADSMHCHGILRIGDNSIYHVPDVFVSGYGTVDQVRTSQGRFALVKGTSNPVTLSDFSNIKFGIGIQTPQHSLHLHRQTATPNPSPYLLRWPSQTPLPAVGLMTGSRWALMRTALDR